MVRVFGADFWYMCHRLFIEMMLITLVKGNERYCKPIVGLYE